MVLLRGMSGGRARRSHRQEEAVREWDHGAGSIGFPLLLSFTGHELEAALL